MSKKQKTNEEFVQDLMTFSRRGALIQPFVITALEKYAQQVIASSGEDWPPHHMIEFGAWQDCAKEVIEKLNAQYGGQS